MARQQRQQQSNQSKPEEKVTPEVNTSPSPSNEVTQSEVSSAEPSQVTEASNVHPDNSAGALANSEPPKQETQQVEIPKGVQAKQYGIDGNVTTVDTKELRNMIISLTRGYTRDYDGLGMTAKIQKLFHLESFADAKALHTAMMMAK